MEISYTPTQEAYMALPEEIDDLQEKVKQLEDSLRQRSGGNEDDYGSLSTLDLEDEARLRTDLAQAQQQLIEKLVQVRHIKEVETPALETKAQELKEALEQTKAHSDKLLQDNARQRDLNMASHRDLLLLHNQLESNTSQKRELLVQLHLLRDQLHRMDFWPLQKDNLSAKAAFHVAGIKEKQKDIPGQLKECFEEKLRALEAIIQQEILDDVVQHENSVQEAKVLMENYDSNPSSNKKQGVNRAGSHLATIIAELGATLSDSETEGPSSARRSRKSRKARTVDDIKRDEQKKQQRLIANAELENVLTSDSETDEPVSPSKPNSKRTLPSWVQAINNYGDKAGTVRMKVQEKAKNAPDELTFREKMLQFVPLSPRE